ncbi:MAG: hypothetical protein WKF40_05465 [Thermoleophilaceae bacterium]
MRGGISSRRSPPPTAAAGRSQRIEELADRLIDSDHIVALEGGEAGAAIRTAGGGRIRSGEPLLTTVDMLEIEATSARRGHRQGRGRRCRHRPRQAGGVRAAPQRDRAL